MNSVTVIAQSKLYLHSLTYVYMYTEYIEWFTEGQAFSPKYDLAPAPLSRQ
jgi:hypothetical protein